MDDTQTSSLEKKKSCINCGAELTFLPGTTTLSCEYCGHAETIESNNEFEELELKPYLEKMGNQSHTMEIAMISCKSCGATQHIEENYKSLHCVYCTSTLIIDDAKQEEWILPGAILPFQIYHKKSMQLFFKWVNQLWFAPNTLKKASLQPENTKGLYLPYWTFDAQLYADYTGEKGTYYYVDVDYTTTVNGKRVKRTRRERRTRWRSTNGNVSGFVDDTLISASHQKKNQIPSKIRYWNLDNLKPFNNDYLAGFITEKYTIPLKKGHLSAKDEAANIATNWARQDIGGDDQRVNHLDISLTEETFKHILLPVFISSYEYKGKIYHFYVNGQTGTVSGERPYSPWKIALVIMAVIIIILIIVFLSEK